MNKDKWAYHNPVRIYFGRGCRASLAEVLAERRTLIVCSPRGRQQLESDALLGQAFRSSKSSIWMGSVQMNPDLGTLQEMTDELQAAHPDCIIGFGGGSAIDSAKVLALALSSAACNRSLRKLLSAAASFPVGAALPLYAVPTTAGTGSEVTPYATVWDHAERRKLSLAGPVVYPYTALVDPELTDFTPYNITLNTGLDAINQAAESIWNRNMTPVSEMNAHRALKLGTFALPNLLSDLENCSLRDTMAEVSLLAGLAISQTKTSICHAISYPLTAHFGVPHGLACAFTMPAVLRRSLDVNDGRFDRLAKTVSLTEDASTNNLLDFFETMNKKLQVPAQVREKVGSLASLIGLREQMFTAGRVENALFNVDRDVLTSILGQAWQCGGINI